MDKPKILFLCTGNSCRSQMAEGWTRRLWGDRFEAWSAGMEPRPVDPRAIQAMAEAGVDISGQYSKPISTVMDVRFDYVVTLCGSAFENCPYFPGKTVRLHAGFDDPPSLAENAATEEEKMAPYRRVRDEIRRFIETLPSFLEQGAS